MSYPGDTDMKTAVWEGFHTDQRCCRKIRRIFKAAIKK